MSGSIIPLRPASNLPHPQRDTPILVAFDRAELSLILSVYGRMVAAGAWRDYAIDHLKEAAVFSIFKGTAESALFRVEKRPKLAARQGAYAVQGPDGQILKRGRELAQVLKVFDSRRVQLLR